MPDDDVVPKIKAFKVIALKHIAKKDIDIAGGKGANLGELLQHGFPVPPGYVVTAQAYASHIQTIESSSPQLITPTGTTDCAKIQAKIIDTKLDQTLASEIENHHKQLQRDQAKNIVYAVRSSATAEDLGDASFAGQHETYYYVTAENLIEMIKKCWASLWSEAAYSYRQSQGINHHDVNMAVVVQEMIAASVSGVTFTNDPLSGNTDLIVTDCSWGMGAAIVDGRVTPDQFVFSKSKQRLESKRIADKKFMVPSDEPIGTARLIAVPFSQRHKETLSSSQIQEVAKWALKCESYFAAPQDLEWAFKDEQFFLLQSRSITTIGKKNDTIPKGKFVLFKPLIENFTDPLLPLTQDLLIKLFPMMKIIQGRVYVNLNHLKILMPFKISDDEAAKLAYLSNNDVPNMKVSVPRLVLLMSILAFNHLNFAVLFKRTERMPDDFMQLFRKKFKAVVEDDSISAPQTLEHLFFKSKFFDPVGTMPLMVNLTAPRYMILMHILTKLLAFWIPDIRQDATAYLTAGSEGVLSTDMGREINKLAETARKVKSVRDNILNLEPKHALDTLKALPAANDFITALNAFLAIHGHRTLKEFELNSVRWEEDPTPIIAMIRNYLHSEPNTIDAESKAKIKRQLFADEIRLTLLKKPLEAQFGLRWALVEFLRKQTKYFIKLRENSRFFHIMGFYAIRLKILSLEKTLLNSGKLKCKDDIYYLHWPELSALHAGEISWNDIEETLRARRMEYIRLTKIKPEKTFGIMRADSNKTTEVPINAEKIIGHGASPGIYKGIARVITDPSIDTELHRGEILVAPYTDPAWTPLFLTASAAVVEVGSFLSHAGTIAREYGLPCVVDAPDCTTRIKSGDTILVNGSTGVVSLLKSEEST